MGRKVLYGCIYNPKFNEANPTAIVDSNPSKKATMILSRAASVTPFVESWETLWDWLWRITKPEHRQKSLKPLMISFLTSSFIRILKKVASSTVISHKNISVFCSRLVYYWNGFIIFGSIAEAHLYGINIFHVIRYDQKFWVRFPSRISPRGESPDEQLSWKTEIW